MYILKNTSLKLNVFVIIKNDNDEKKFECDVISILSDFQFPGGGSIEKSGYNINLWK